MSTITLDWEVTKAYFDATAKTHDSDWPWLKFVYYPLEKRYEAGERSVELFDAMMEVR